LARRELRATLTLAWPLVIAQLVGILLFTTDVVMMSRLGSTYLAAGSLATALLHPIFINALGVTTATAPRIAQAFGARGPYRQTHRGDCIAITVLSVATDLIGSRPNMGAV